MKNKIVSYFSLNENTIQLKEDVEKVLKKHKETTGEELTYEQLEDGTWAVINKETNTTITVVNKNSEPFYSFVEQTPQEEMFYKILNIISTNRNGNAPHDRYSSYV